MGRFLTSDLPNQEAWEGDSTGKARQHLFTDKSPKQNEEANRRELQPSSEALLPEVTPLATASFGFPGFTEPGSSLACAM